MRLLVTVLLVSSTSLAAAQTCPTCPAVVEPRTSWVFAPGTYTHDPATGARVAQYQRVDPVEGLPDPRLVTSGYRRVRTNLRGNNGSLDSAYEVQSWGNGRGRMDAEWERFHSAWLQSSTAGGYYNQQGGYAPYGGGYGYGQAGGGGYGPGYGGGFGGGYGPIYGGGYNPPNGYPPVYGVPPYGPTPTQGPHFRQRQPDLE